MRGIKSNLLQQRNVASDRLKKTQINIALKNPALKEQLEKLKDFFPNINMEKLLIIDSFHANITAILRDTLKETERELEANILFYGEQIKKLNNEIDTKMNLQDVPRYTTERLVDLAMKKDRLTKNIELYKTKQELKNNLRSARNDLTEIKIAILSDISNLINIEMNTINGQIYSDGRQPPNLRLDENRYTFNVFNDTGTGKAYSNLLTLDLAIFNTTNLPILIHDTMLFKNIENLALENIIGIYDNVQTRQIFIAIDELNKFDKKVSDKLEERSVLKLSYDKTLFIKNWKRNNSDKSE
ncbi:MAG: DUF2326 domain-containing protein [Treponema sp.]|nr:DUF2326 domain-containing protein [Treponema sp.]